MKAILLSEIGKPFELANVSVPEIGVDEVLIETHTCGICRTDLHIQDGLAYVPKLPHIPGHEPAGVVVEVGSDVHEVEVGQRVVPHLFVRSDECRYSLSGQDAQATHLEGILGVTMPGGFAEYFKVPARNLFVLPENVPFDVGGLTSCAVITAVHAYRKSGLQAGDTAVVLGIGGIGLLLVQLLSSAGVRTVAVSRSMASLEFAAQSGATLSLLIEANDTADRIRDFARDGKDGADCVFEMVGLAGTMKSAADYTMRGGRIVVIGEEAEYPAIDTIQIAQRELQIIGSRNGGRQDAIDALDMMAAGIIRPRIAKTFALDDFNEAIAHVRRGDAHGRVVVKIK